MAEKVPSFLEWKRDGILEPWEAGLDIFMALGFIALAGMLRSRLSRD